MGTNYYARRGACKTCGHSHNETHIGKSSGGWNFSLHVTPTIKSLEDWMEILRDKDITIFNEYGDEVSIAEMLDTITKRPNPRELMTHTVDGIHCVGTSGGTYDYIQGEFC